MTKKPKPKPDLKDMDRFVWQPREIVVQKIKTPTEPDPLPASTSPKGG